MFASILILVRQHAGPFALRTVYRQMEESLFYETEVVQLPHGIKTWVSCLHHYIVLWLDIDSL